MSHFSKKNSYISLTQQTYKMKIIVLIGKITLITILLGIFHAAYNRQQLSSEAIYIGLVHGFILGFLLGSFIAFKKHYLNYTFRRVPFLFVILINSTVYLFIILFGRAMGMMITHGREFRILQFDDPNFLGTILFVFTGIFIFNLVDQISLLTGQKQLLNFVVGKYSHAQMENRMIMFIDMADSTAITEKIGDTKYLSLLDEFFSLMTMPLEQTKGEIYKYIGDEAIITWSKNQQDAHIPVRFFYKFKKAIHNHEIHLMEKYGIVPKFRAGLHYGSMLIGELGSVKKEIALIGDSLNTTSRILDVGKRLNHELVLSEILGKQFTPENLYVNVSPLGEQVLKGKEEKLFLYSVVSKKSINPKKRINKIGGIASNIKTLFF